MLFNSISYALFLPVVFLIYWLIPQKFKWILLLISSCFFYMCWDPRYILLIFFIIISTYISGILIEKSKSARTGKIILLSTGIMCIGTLFTFKYINFALLNIVRALNLFSFNLNYTAINIILPVGISFYTFQSLSYVVDVYRGEIAAEKNLGHYAAFISFFPQLVAGPIERAKNLLPQICSPKKFNEDQAICGTWHILWGLFKKMVVADYISQYVDMVYYNVHSYSGLSLIIATFLFTIQIYCDFSGYSNVAIGSAKLLGIELMDNFRSPYFSGSIKEFWSRWHISLSTWLKDYVYIPLGGNRHGKMKKYRNLLITFFLSGLWHGAHWNFLVWGIIHGIAQVIEDYFNKYTLKFKKSKPGKILSWLIVFAFCNFAWIFFRAESLGNAVYIISHCFKGSTGLENYTAVQMCYIAVLILIITVVDLLNYNGKFLNKIRNLKKPVQFALFTSLFVITFIFSRKGETAEFVYFQF